ncbi:DUF3039 domain-containing protein [Galactobacter valiniphilus]|uniref:DUF3039 domain-containing protein n=1 Tax=Galactobacter valiniphilus TaxID=2676122 RepID=A0A399J641_9MICC|nr:DUF3039 domain-containing protein [Galactobacter valiniphilus]RII40938.1 DUF3039 domain-containing protein [Galactobacter valiniphilus]
MSAATVEAPTLTPSAPGDHDRFSHFARADQIADALVFGLAIEALCGKKWVPTADPSRFPVCPACQELYDAMDPGTEVP